MRNKIFISTFIILLTLPLLDSAFNIAPIKDLFEKRILSQNPDFPKNLDELEKYPGQFEEYFNDNYGFRKTLVSLNARIMDDIFNESPDARAVIGKDGWLYFDNEDSLLDFSGRAKISDDLINKNIDAFYRNWQQFKRQNIGYLLVIAADKATIYPEYIPDYIKQGKTHRIDKFLEALLKKYPDFPVLDLRPILLSAKKNEIIYHKTDTHWNRSGAHYAYVKILEKLSNKNHKFKPNYRNRFSNVDSKIIGDISLIIGSSKKETSNSLLEKFSRKSRPDKLKNYEKGFYKAQKYVNSDKTLPRLFAYKDSFFGELNTLMSEHFSYMLLANEFPCDINYKTVKRYQPDYVIQQFWENRIESILNKCN